MGFRIHAAAAALCLALAGCISPTDMAAVETAAATFHQRQQAGDDAANYGDAVDAFKTALTEPDFARIEAAVRAAPSCGAPTRDPNNFRTNASTSGTFVTVVYNRTCANGPISETLTFQIIAGAPKLAGYFVGGMALFPAAAPTATSAPPAEAKPDAPAATPAPPPASPT
jgi:hypothetical protein